MKRFYFLCALALLATLPAAAQRNVIESDRPGQVPSPYTVPQGVFQAELGALNGLYTENGSTTSTVFNFPLTLRFGLTSGIEARVSSNVYQFNAVDRDGVADNSDGFADIVAGAKVTIPAGTNVNVVVIPEVIIPVAEDQGRDPRLNTNEVGFRGNFVARFDLGASPIELNTLIGTDVLKQFKPDASGDTKYYAYANVAARLAGDINPRTKLFGEIGAYPKLNDFNDRYAVINVGAKFWANDIVQFDMFGGRAFAKSAPYDWTFGLGVSTRW